MAEIFLKLDLPEQLLCDLETAARETRMTVNAYAAQCVEVMIATRRLSRTVTTGFSPRMVGELRSRTRINKAESLDTAVLNPIDIPTASDLETLGDVA